MTRYVVDSSERSESKGRRSNSRNKIMIWSNGETSSRFSGKRFVITGKVAGDKTWWEALSRTDCWEERLFSYSVKLLIALTFCRRDARQLDIYEGMVERHWLYTHQLNLYERCGVHPCVKRCNDGCLATKQRKWGRNLHFQVGIEPATSVTLVGCLHHKATNISCELGRLTNGNFGYVYTIPDGLCADTKTISDRAYVNKGIADFGAVFTMERRCAASIVKVNRHVSDRFSYHSLASCEQVPDRSRSQ